jgi:ABC-type lipoprotein export system ATPase subunit/DNA-binding MarR family transcriptional regulator
VSGNAIEEIENWSTSQSLWRRDCLRRLAISNDLAESDVDELLAMVRSSGGLSTLAPPPTPVPFTKAHFGGVKGTPIVLKRLANVQNVNRLLPGASLEFCPKGLTIVYGRNGSGKSGFVRILRTACRTRVDNPAKLKILANVYGVAVGPQSADIVIETATGEETIGWEPGMVADPLLAQVAVFDSQSAQLYVDSGNQIRYLPFGLALPHRLNTVCLTLREKIEAEKSTVVGDKPGLTAIAFTTIRPTKAQLFDKAVTAKTTDIAIAASTIFAPDDKQRLDEIAKLLAAGTAAVADLSSLLGWVEAVRFECEFALKALDDTALDGLTGLRDKAVAARQAAELAAGELFTDEPLPGVGSETWRALWAAAREYSLTEAYPDRPFPVTSLDGDQAACVLCQQPLLPEAGERLQRFRKFMDDKLDAAANAAEKAVAEAQTGVPKLDKLGGDEFGQRLEQVRQRDTALADALSDFRQSAVARRKEAEGRLNGDTKTAVPPMSSPSAQLQTLADRLQIEKGALTQVANSEERKNLVEEQAELEDRRILAANSGKLTTRRDLMVKEAAYKKALDEVQTKGITTKANQLLDTHLTAAVTSHFDEERAKFDILHLKVALARKSGQTKAEFEMDPQTKLARVTSEILSEGEQRALALAGFLTEVELTEGSGPIIVDDPVSSLDRDRSLRVAERLATEACKRQVVVFTHDLVFFNELCRAADDAGIEPVTIALFSDTEAAGKVDPAGVVWKGLNVAKRIGQLKNDSAGLPKLQTTSPAEYETKAKNLYSRLRDTYERFVEEVIFCDIVRRGVDVIQTQLLRFVTLPDGLAIRFHEGMTKANTYSHDNPASDTVKVPTPDEFKADLAELEKLVEEFKVERAKAEAARPQMKLKAK